MIVVVVLIQLGAILLDVPLSSALKTPMVVTPLLMLLRLILPRWELASAILSEVPCFVAPLASVLLALPVVMPVALVAPRAISLVNTLSLISRGLLIGVLVAFKFSLLSLRLCGVGTFALLVIPFTLVITRGISSSANSFGQLALFYCLVSETVRQADDLLDRGKVS